MVEDGDDGGGGLAVKQWKRVVLSCRNVKIRKLLSRLHS